MFFDAHFDFHVLQSQKLIETTIKSPREQFQFPSQLQRNVFDLESD